VLEEDLEQGQAVVQDGNSLGVGVHVDRPIQAHGPRRDTHHSGVPGDVLGHLEEGGGREGGSTQGDQKKEEGMAKSELRKEKDGGGREEGRKFGGREGEAHHAVGPHHDAITQSDSAQDFAACTEHTARADGRMTLSACRHLLAGRAQSD